MVHISQFYSCSKISIPCELFYVCEIGKYLSIAHNEVLSLDGVVFTPEVQASKYFNYLKLAVENNWVYTTEDLSQIDLTTIDFNSLHNLYLTEEDIDYTKDDRVLRKKDLYYNFVTPLKKQYKLSDTDFPNTFYFRMDVNGTGDNYINNGTFNNVNADVTWLSFIAKFAVRRYVDNVPYNLVIEFDHQALLNSFAISYIKILQEENKAVFNSWVFCKYAEGIELSNTYQYSYYAWYRKGKDLGMLSRDYTIKEKLDYLKSLDIQEGDFVLFYERDAGFTNNAIKSIKSCRMARIDKINGLTISFTFINDSKVRAQAKWDYDNLSMQLKQWYAHELPYEKINTSTVSKDLMDLGIKYQMYTELFFIAPLEEADEEIVQVVDVKHNMPIKLKLSQNELLYWILKSYDFKFDEQRFRDRYLKGEIPLYEKYTLDLPIDSNLFVIDNK